MIMRFYGIRLHKVITFQVAIHLTGGYFTALVIVWRWGIGFNYPRNFDIER